MTVKEMIRSKDYEKGGATLVAKYKYNKEGETPTITETFFNVIFERDVIYNLSMEQIKALRDVIDHALFAEEE